MAEKMLMLALSPTMEEGVIAKWRKADGDKVSSGDVVCDVETDKAVMEYQSQVEGTLLTRTVDEGGSAAVGEIIAIVGEQGEDISTIQDEAKAQQQTKGDKKQKARRKKEEPKGEEPRETEEAETPRRPPGENVRSSPLARRVAHEKGLDIAQIPGSGPHGRVVVADVEAAAQRGPARPPAARFEKEEIAITQKRRIIAQRLSESKYSRPHYYLTASAQVDELLAARQAYNAKANEKLSFNAYLIKLTAEALRRHRLVNSTWTEDRIILHARVDMAVAVEQDDGLITPVIRNCEAKGIVQIDAELRELVDKARANKLQPEEYSNSTFTITNLGSFGIEQFTAIINPPNSAILAVGEVRPTPVVGPSGQVEVHSMMKLTLACDHRVVDGAKAARFLTTLKEILQQPANALL